jgi:histidinol-phosphate aminotransferase
MKSFSVQNLLRDNIKNLVAYSSARSEFNGNASIFLDANENSIGSLVGGQYNRYPDPQQVQLKAELAKLKGVNPEQLFLGNGSDEAIDLLFRAFCDPSQDSVLYFPPTYGMYEIAARINNVVICEVPLDSNFQIDVQAAINEIQPSTKIIFICSPNNPTGNLIASERIEFLLNHFQGIVVVDEAYIDFSEKESWVSKLNQYPNLVVLQTLSKAWGLAGLRIGMAIASPEIISVLNKIKYPYNISSAVQELAVNAIAQVAKKDEWIRELNKERELLISKLEEIAFVNKVFPTDANFVLVRFLEANKIYEYLKTLGIITRNRSGITLCEGCLRITIGTKDENNQLIKALNNFQ